MGVASRSRLDKERNQQAPPSPHIRSSNAEFGQLAMWDDIADRRGLYDVGMTTADTRSHYFGRCHCGSVQFEVTLSDGLRTARRCNCSMCRMRGAVAVSAALDGLRVTTGNEHLSSYQFNTRTAKHYFCSICGIYTHHQRRSNPEQYGVNAACLDGISPFDFEKVQVLDGVNHPQDAGPGSKAEVFGVLSFQKL